MTKPRRPIGISRAINYPVAKEFEALTDNRINFEERYRDLYGSVISDFAVGNVLVAPLAEELRDVIILWENMSAGVFNCHVSTRGNRLRAEVINLTANRITDMGK